MNRNINLITLAGKDQRINSIQEGKWIGYSKARDLHQTLEYLLIHPKIDRMPAMLTVAATGNGKTVALKRFVDAHHRVVTPQGMNIPVLYVQAPFKPDEKMFCIGILKALNAPHLITGTVSQLYQQIMRILTKAQTRIVVIDEIHHILTGGHISQRIFLAMLKHFANELQIVVVAAGIKDALNAIGSDEQLANRFEPFILPRWSMNEDYLRLLSSFESILPLKKPSDLTCEEKALKILSLSGGTIGEISTLLKKAAVLAIITGKECIDMGLLNTSHSSPAARKQQYESIVI